MCVEEIKSILQASKRTGILAASKTQENANMRSESLEGKQTADRPFSIVVSHTEMLQDVKNGSIVRHKTFGEGQVVNVSISA